MALGPRAQTTTLVGSMLGKDYRVLEQIGQGGMAVVYLVEHQKLLKRFAAKVLAPEHAASTEAHARFTQEAHAASQLDHENIVTISDFGVTADQRPFFVMELLRGQSLDVRLDAGPMAIEEVVAVCVPVARALAHAHAEGIIHRDVKPENIFLVQRSQGRWGVKVLDFGIAKVPVNQHLTAMGQALGSPMFMSPEACRGEDVDQRADIYSFGILLYLMLTGRVPFADESLLKILQMQVSTPLPSPREFKPDLSPGLEAVVVRALAKDPDDRYQTMDELLFELEAALPEGSDSLLILAQFGTTLQSTPFPATLSVRQSQRMARVSMMNVAAHGTGSRSSPQLPTAPRKRGRGAVLAFLTLTLLGAAGAGGYYLWQRTDAEGATVDQPPVATQAAVQVPAVVTAPPPVVEPPAPVAELPAPKVEEPVEPEPIEPPPIDKPAPKTGKQIVKRAAAPPPKKTPAPAKPVASVTASPKVAPAQPGSAAPASPEPTPVTTPPVVAPPVEPPPAPKPAPKPAPEVVAPKPAPAPPVKIGTLDATPVIASLEVNGALPSSVVRRTVERTLPALRACYRAAAKAGKSTPQVTVSLRFEIDENSSATRVSASGASFGSLASCVRSAVTGVRTQQAPDVGTVHVVVAIAFRPTP
jgi:serine/threonine-protein kinase